MVNPNCLISFMAVNIMGLMNTKIALNNFLVATVYGLIPTSCQVKCNLCGTKAKI